MVLIKKLASRHLQSSKGMHFNLNSITSLGAISLATVSMLKPSAARIPRKISLCPEFLGIIKVVLRVTDMRRSPSRLEIECLLSSLMVTRRLGTQNLVLAYGLGIDRGDQSFVTLCSVSLVYRFTALFSEKPSQKLNISMQQCRRKEPAEGKLVEAVSELQDARQISMAIYKSSATI